jgi:hypothetical protein
VAVLNLGGFVTLRDTRDDDGHQAIRNDVVAWRFNNLFNWNSETGV